jgi:hypothetical protein
MKRAEFAIGMIFWCHDSRWRCTDVGTRTITAIRLDRVEVSDTVVSGVLTETEARSQGWFNGPRYAVAESVFDEYDMPACRPVDPGLSFL